MALKTLRKVTWEAYQPPDGPGSRRHLNTLRDGKGIAISYGGRIVEKRTWPRFRSEVIVSFLDGDSEATGVTWDVSRAGMFVRSSKMPEVGSKLMVRMRFSEDRQLVLQGRVVRCFSAPALVRHLFPSGFGLEIGGSDLYPHNVGTLQRAPPPPPPPPGATPPPPPLLPPPRRRPARNNSPPPA